MPNTPHTITSSNGDNPNEFYQNGTLPVQNASTQTNTTQNKEELRIPEDLLERDAKKYLIMRSNLALLKDETGTYIRNTILNDYYMELRKSSQAHQSGIEEGKKAERNEIYRILSEELSVAYPDPRTGFRDMIEMEVEDLINQIDKSLKENK